MKINVFYKDLIITFLGFLCVLFLGSKNVYAVLQSNGNTPTSYDLHKWLTEVRKMEALGGAMGLSETIGGNLMPTTGSNNIDVHMQKNTEYGAMAILSASAYGNPNKIGDGQTTTGNSTGVVMKLNKEMVAAGVRNTASAVYQKAANRYKNNKYPQPYIGDAMIETKTWHGSLNNTLPDENYFYDYLLLRACEGSIFQYTGGSSYHISLAFFSRAVIVSGEDI